MKTIASPRLLALSLLVAMPVYAAAPAANSEFGKLDRNSDGKITLAEAKTRAELEVRFEQLDRNHDGVLTPEEFGQNGQVTPPADPATVPGGSAGAQHMPNT